MGSYAEYSLKRQAHNKDKIIMQGRLGGQNKRAGDNMSSTKEN